MSIGYLGLVSCSNIKVENLTLVNNVQGILLVNTSYSIITNCQIYNNDDNGIYLQESSNNNQITNCQVYNNSYGIGLYYSSNNKINYNDIYNNGEYGVYNTFGHDYVVNALNNWWGDASGPSGEGSGTGDAVNDNVFYDPWLTEPVNPINHPPVVNIITASPTTVKTGGTVTITISATDEDNDALTYHYACSGGTISGTGNTVTWFAPNTVGSYTVSVYVNDGTVNSHSKTITITVTDGGGGNTTDGGEDDEGEKEEEKGFIPAFETAAFLVAILGVCIILLRRRKEVTEMNKSSKEKLTELAELPEDVKT